MKKSVAAGCVFLFFCQTLVYTSENMEEIPEDNRNGNQKRIHRFAVGSGFKIFDPALLMNHGRQPFIPDGILSDDHLANQSQIQPVHNAQDKNPRQERIFLGGENGMPGTVYCHRKIYNVLAQVF